MNIPRRLATVRADTTPGNLQTLAAEYLGYIPGVTGGTWPSVTLAQDDAPGLLSYLLGRGYAARLD